MTGPLLLESSVLFPYAPTPIIRFVVAMFFVQKPRSLQLPSPPQTKDALLSISHTPGWARACETRIRLTGDEKKLIGARRR